MSTPATPNTPLWTDQAKTGEDGLRRVACWASIAMFLVWIGFSGLAFVWNLDQRSLLHRAQTRPFSVSLDEVRDADARVDFLNKTQLVLLVVTAACFITWLYLEYRRVQRANEPTRFEAGWAIGAWFVPFLNWFRPYQVMADVWNATAGRRAKSRALVGAWWGCYIGSLLILVAADSGEDTPTLEDALHENALYIARAVLVLVAAVLALLMVCAVLRSPAGDVPVEALDASES
jgi:Domain of unknown function (DUF4328)